MTEDEWQECADHSKLFEYLRPSDTVPYRRYRLFLTACCRAFLPDMIASERTWRLIELAEDYADDSVGREELARAKRIALAAVRDNPRLDTVIRGVSEGLPHRQAVEFPFFCLNPWDTSNFNRPTASQQRRLCDLIRDIFPFRSIALDPSWLTSTVASLARQMYSCRDFSGMPILADALQDAGCDDCAILEHCRGSGPHVRGCFVIDLLTGRS